MGSSELIDLAAANANTVGDVLGQDYVVSSAFDRLSVEGVLDANHHLADVVYGDEVARLLRIRDIDELNRRHLENGEQFMANDRLLDDVDASCLGVVLLRPEVAGLADQFRQTLEGHGLALVHDQPLRINFEQYWGMYHHGLTHPDSYYDFPTRTLCYVNRVLQIMVVTDTEPQNRLGDQTTSEVLHSFKGRQGVHEPGTLRGGIAYTALQDCVDPAVVAAFRMPWHNLALDPIGAYRHLVRGMIGSDDMHTQADSPLLFYAGQAVHVPDDSEVLRDLAVLCTADEIDKIASVLETG